MEHCRHGCTSGLAPRWRATALPGGNPFVKHGVLWPSPSGVPGGVEAGAGEGASALGVIVGPVLDWDLRDAFERALAMRGPIWLFAVESSAGGVRMAVGG